VSDPGTKENGPGREALAEGTPSNGRSLRQVGESLMDSLRTAREGLPPPLRVRNVGRVESVQKGVARVLGLPGVGSEEIVMFPKGIRGLALNLDPGAVGVVLLGSEEEVEAGAEVRETGRMAEIPVGREVLGRVVNPLGHPLDEGGPLRTSRRRAMEQPAPPIMDRSPVRAPLQTGLKVVDALVPVGRGQRELIVGDRQTGKTSLAVDTIINQREHGVVCVYCAVGQRSSSVARVVEDLRSRDSMAHTVVMVARGEDPPGLQYLAPFAAMTMAEFFRDEGEDVLVVLDDLTHHARAYRELSLLLRRPPGREGYPGDIFYLHSRLLERATRLRDERGGGSITALPIVETQEGNISAYIPTNLISITDGQIFLSPKLFRKGIIPAVDVGRSVSRVGGDAQLPAYKAVVQDLRLSYAQFEELEVFSRFASQVDEETRQALTRGRRVREALKQEEHSPLSPCAQLCLLLAVNRGVLDELPLEDVQEAVERLQENLPQKHRKLCHRIHEGEALEEEDRDALVEEAQKIVSELRQEGEESADERAQGAGGGTESPSEGAESSDEYEAENPDADPDVEGGAGAEEKDV
jgi:F-type H+/Na+-transporting ATPase subunit alpha